MAKIRAKTDETTKARAALLEWYERNRRDLPWRRIRDPYAIWVSEVMLQQTRVAVVVERYLAFMARFPTVATLAMAPEQDVLALWSGLGYYRRARMLHKAAQVVSTEHNGIMPETAEGLRKLAGIGDYTSAAIASIAYGERVAVVDGNVERVLCRLAGWEAGNGTGSADRRRKIGEMAANLLDPGRPGDFNQAMMELGATVCLPRNPQCLVCPLSAGCTTRGEHKTAPRPQIVSREVGYALCLRGGGESDEDGGSAEVLLEQRPASVTVMPGLWELPTLINQAGPAEDACMTLRHAIMNVNYVVRVRAVREDDVAALSVTGGERRWVSLGKAGAMALTGLARKVLKRAHLLPASRLDAGDVVNA
jgi:A/G-specific adenine glycosylase